MWKQSVLLPHWNYYPPGFYCCPPFPGCWAILSYLVSRILNIRQYYKKFYSYNREQSWSQKNQICIDSYRYSPEFLFCDSFLNLHISLLLPYPIVLHFIPLDSLLPGLLVETPIVTYCNGLFSLLTVIIILQVDIFCSMYTFAFQNRYISNTANLKTQLHALSVRATLERHFPWHVVPGGGDEGLM